MKKLIAMATASPQATLGGTGHSAIIILTIDTANAGMPGTS